MVQRKNQAMGKVLIMESKGISPVIAWVLLVGLTVTLAISVFNWSREQAEDVGKSIASKTEKDVRCENVAFNAVCDKGDVNVINKGDFTIHKFIIHEYAPSGVLANLEKAPANPLKPGGSKLQYLYTMSKAAQEIDLLPVIKIEEEFVPCVNRKIVVECS